MISVQLLLPVSRFRVLFSSAGHAAWVGGNPFYSWLLLLLWFSATFFCKPANCTAVSYPVNSQLKGVFCVTFLPICVGGAGLVRAGCGKPVQHCTGQVTYLLSHHSFELPPELSGCRVAHSALLLDSWPDFCSGSRGMAHDHCEVEKE